MHSLDMIVAFMLDLLRDQGCNTLTAIGSLVVAIWVVYKDHHRGRRLRHTEETMPEEP